MRAITLVLAMTPVSNYDLDVLAVTAMRSL